MWIILALSVLAAGRCSAQSGAVEKLSNNIIRNISTYHNFYPSLTDPIIFMDISEDLINWKYYGFLLRNKSPWSTNHPYPNLDINVVAPKKVRLYYTAVSQKTSRLEIGVGTAQGLNVTDNWAAKKESLVSNEHDITMPSLITLNNGSLLLTFSIPDSSLGAVILDADGTAVISDTVQLVAADQEWEAGKVGNQWGLQRGHFVYVFYETGAGAVGVARSKDPLGPYEKILMARHRAPSRGHFRNALKWGLDDWPFF